MLLQNVLLERTWPIASPEILAYTELKQDEMYPEIRPNQIMSYIEGALACGRQAGDQYDYVGNLARLMDLVLQSGAKVVFVDEKKRDGEQLIRAQYEPKPPIIYIYRPSIEQMERFFLKSGYRIQQEDLIALHVCHEWFHHLEETETGRTDQKLPKVTVRKVGPVSFKRSIEKTREIAAHAFTQTVMDLKWYPMLLDVLIGQEARNVKKEQIRERFRMLRQEMEQEQKVGEGEPPPHQAPVSL